MERKVRFFLVLFAALSFVFAGCKEKKGDGDVEDGEEVDVVDTTDTVEDTEPDVEPDTEPDVEPDTEPDVEPDTEPDVEPDTEPDVELDTEPDVEPDTEPDVEPDVEDVVEEEIVCIPDGVGTSPTPEHGACFKATSCVPLPGMDPADFITACIFLEYAAHDPFYGEPIEYVMITAGLYFYNEAVDNAACVNAAADCTAVFDCLNSGSTSTCTVSGAFPVEGRTCTGSVLSACQRVDPSTGDGYLFEHDCADDGLSCVEVTGVGAMCADTDCTTPGTSCDRDNVDFCIADGVHLVIDCDEVSHGSGGTCGDADPTTAGDQLGCVPTGGACDPTTDADYCRRDEHFTCDDEFNQWTSVDCDDISSYLDCSTATTCDPDWSSLTCTVTEHYCDCDDIVLCNVFTNEDTRIHCPDYGFSTCGDTDPATPGDQIGCM